MPVTRIPRRLALASLIGLLGTTPAYAGLTATTSTDIPAARAAFLLQATVLGAYDWSSQFAPGTHTLGNLGPMTSTNNLIFTASDGAFNTISSSNGNGAPLALGNWIDRPGFNTADGLSAAADLALNGTESFDLGFAHGYRSVGLAILSGQSNLSTEVDLLGASFDFFALDQLGQRIGSASLVLPAGAPAARWVTLVSSTPIFGLQVRETAAVSANDQYFSNIYATPADVTAVPEPSSALLASLGLMMMGAYGRMRAYTGMRASTRSTITPL